MLSLSGLSHRRAPALMAILAILMLFIAPEISQSLAQQRALKTTSTGSAHLMMMPDRQADNGMAQPPPHGAHRHHDAADEHASAHPTRSSADPAIAAGGSMQDFACGYCELLAHFPLAIWIFVPLIWLLFVASRASPQRLIPTFPVPLFTGQSQPRAPPFI